jgi:hypothetical protein
VSVSIRERTGVSKSKWPNVGVSKSKWQSVRGPYQRVSYRVSNSKQPNASRNREFLGKRISQ